MTQNNKQRVTIDGLKYEIVVTEKTDGMVTVELYNRKDMGSSMITAGHPDNKVRVTSYQTVRIVDDTPVERA